MAIFEESASAHSTAVPDFYSWTFPGAPVRIHLHLDAVDRLSLEVRRAFESVPSHSVEIGGLLLGRADLFTSPIVEIKDFEPFLCEYRTDHRFVLSDSDRRKFEKQLEARKSARDGLTVVGFYRSQIGEGLCLDEQDVALVRALFHDPANVFLLVKPSADGSSTAGFFFWDNGRIDSEFTFLEFPFDARQLTGAQAQPSTARAKRGRAVREDHGEPTAFGISEDAQSPEHEFPAEEEKRDWRRLRWLWYPLFAVLMLVLGAAGYQAYHKWSAAAPVAATGAPDTPLALQVERKGDDLRVSWSRTAPAVVHAKEAMLSIRDGEGPERELRLELEQLRNGSVLYTAANNSVQFRLDVTAPDNTKTSEAVLALMAAKNDASQAPALTLSRQPSITQPPEPAAAKPPVSSVARTKKASAPRTPERDFREPVRVALAHPPDQSTGGAAQNPASAHDPVLPPPPSLQTGVTGQAAPERTSAAPPPKPEPVPATAPYTAARPIRQSQPIIPPSISSLIGSAVDVDVQIRIDASGRVVRAEALPSRRPVSSTLVGAARNAAMLWRFEPAKRGNQPVASDLVLKFQYRPAAPQ
jgi:hypothetical protein